jgi:N-acetylmuramoyl-L-alanine amidase
MAFIESRCFVANYSLRRWADWCGRMALLAASGCAASASNTREPLSELPPAGGSIARHTTRPVEPRDNAVAAKSPRNPPATTPRPRASSATSVSARTQSNEPELQQRVVKFTRRPGELINPPVPIRQWQYIVLHHSGEQNGGYASIDRFHRGPERGWDECGYHFVIGNGTESGDGEIEVGSRWLKQKHGAHTHPPGHTEYNEEGLGICLVGDCNQSPPTPRQVEACRRLVAYLQVRCGVPARGVITHGDADGAKTDCPGQYFPYDHLIPRSGFASR